MATRRQRCSIPPRPEANVNLGFPFRSNFPRCQQFLGASFGDLSARYPTYQPLDGAMIPTVSGSISKILVLAVLGPALSFSRPVSASPKLSLNTTIYTQQLATIKLNPPEPVSSPFLYIWNFTLNLTGRDPGSTTEKFAILDPTNLVAVLSDKNLTTLLSTRPPICQTSCPQLVTGIIELLSDAGAATPFPPGALPPYRSDLTPAAPTTSYSIDSTIVYINEIHGHETSTTTTVGQ